MLISTKSIEKVEMIKLSKKIQYATQVMIQLAGEYNIRQLLLKEIADRQGISEKYLWQLIAPLKNGGLINSTRGPQGGYELSCHPGKITLEQVVRHLEGPVDFLDQKTILECSGSIEKVSLEAWKEISEQIKNSLSSITFDDLLKKQKQKEKILEYII